MKKTEMERYITIFKGEEDEPMYKEELSHTGKLLDYLPDAKNRLKNIRSAMPLLEWNMIMDEYKAKGENTITRSIDVDKGELVEEII